MDIATFHSLLSCEGQSTLVEAAALGPTDATFLACFEQLRKHRPSTLAKAAVETALLRRKARDKFPDADRMYFTRDALEQATSEAVARHRARRFAKFGQVADLCCGIGGDALALAATGLAVDAIDSDPLRVRMTEANAAALGFADRVRCQTADALAVPLPEAKAAFADPARRADGRRYLNPEDYTPPLSALRARFAPDFPLAVKIAPGVVQADVRDLGAEVEFVSLGGELKECVLWFGPLRTTARRATVLPGGDTLFADNPREPRLYAEVGAFLYDPDPAVTRASLVHDLAECLDTRPVDPQVQLLTADRHTQTPFATVFAVEHVAPFHLKLLRDYLRRHAVGRVTIIKRGSPADADDLLRKLKLEGPHHRTLMLTRTDGWHAMIVCQKVSASQARNL
jgi:SAM-dependent methyltransferase